ncbi:MAG: Asparagine synthetase [glutamine-hydrolyzing] 1 [Chlamydiae bacterium]|nr:Asparagine synthetase [glutamine-hydrolyzing] 1 [Chlamydiota bacterium]
MCGIAAIFGLRAIHKLPLLTKMMTDVIQHRGPDDEGVVLFSQEGDPTILGGEDTPEGVFKENLPYCPKKRRFSDGSYIGALGHRRLSIIDLSPAGHQPMSSEDQRYWIVYNGEIYNYLEIRKELESNGHHFYSHTDTEVILKAFSEWGVDCLHHFNGMFAFVIWDVKERRLFAARDRFGVKPLYYWINPKGMLAFASEIKQFTLLPGWNPKINHQRSYDFLNWGLTDHTEETLFAGVKQLRGGHYIYCPIDNIETQELKTRQWYQLRHSPFKGSFEEASKEFAEMLRDSIRLRLRADVDIGSCLSGGLDSSSIVCFANALLKEKNAEARQKTFSAYSDVLCFDERHYIEIVANRMNVEAHSTTPCLEHMESLVPEIIWHQDEPYGSTSIYAQWLVFDLVKKNKVKVMLDGQGADEHLAGYIPFFGCRFYDLFRSMQWRTLIQEMMMTKKNHPQVNPLFLFASRLVPHAVQQPLRRLLQKTASKPNWIDFRFLSAKNLVPFQSSKQNHLRDQSSLQLMHTSLPMLLRYEDRDSMAHSIESRTPFLDYRLVEFTLGLPSEYKLSHGLTKRVLRKGTEGIMPDEIRNRIDKIGFATAEEEWLTKRRPDVFRKWMDDAIESSQGILNPQARGIVDDIIDGKRKFSFIPWRIICFGHWMQRFSASI